MEKFYLHLDNEQKGPFTLGQLQSMWKAGIILCNTQFFTKANAEWKPLEAIIDRLEPAFALQEQPAIPPPPSYAQPPPAAAVPGPVATRPAAPANSVRCPECGGLGAHLTGCSQGTASAAPGVSPLAAATAAKVAEMPPPTAQEWRNRVAGMMTDKPQSLSAANKPASPISDNMPSFIAAVGMCAAFFMPWVSIMGAGIAGNTLGQAGDEGKAAWLILVFAVLSAVTHFVAPIRLLNVTAGIAPFILLFYFADKTGKELFEHLGIGALLTLGCGLVLIFAPVKAANAKSS